MITVLTLNTWKNDGAYAVRLGLMAAGVAALAADVVLLQESFFAPDIGADTAAALAAAGGYALTRAPMREKPRTMAGHRVPSRSDLAALTRGAPRAHHVWSLPEDPRDGQRLALAVDLDTRVGPLRVVNTHLTHLRDAAAAEVRRAQAAAVLAQARAGWSGPIVIGGDFNDPPESPALAPFFADPAVDAAAALAGWAAVQALPPGPARFLGAIDHVLAFDAAGVLGVAERRLVLDQPDAAGVTPSDHPGVLVALAPANNLRV